MNNTNEPSKLEQILLKIPLESDLYNFGNDLFTKFIQYFENSNANISQENATKETKELRGTNWK